MAGYLPYSIVDGWQQLVKDFGYWRVLVAATETATTRDWQRGSRAIGSFARC